MLIQVRNKITYHPIRLLLLMVIKEKIKLKIRLHLFVRVN